MLREAGLLFWRARCLCPACLAGQSPAPVISAPWWIDRVDALLSKSHLSSLAPGELWRLSSLLGFVRENVSPALLVIDFGQHPRAASVWAAFEAKEAAVLAALRVSVAGVGASVSAGLLPPEVFRGAWERLGFEAHEEGGGTPADDYLDAVTQVSLLTLGEERPSSGMLNMSSRARRISDFLAVTKPGVTDVVFDLGSGSGKVALTVAASARATVRGVELGESYVTAARKSAGALALANLSYQRADVRDVALSTGSIFYLYYPFHGAVAAEVAARLGALGREKDITLYLSGPLNAFAEHFLAQVESRALTLSERRGEFSEVLVLRSARA